MLTNPGFYLAWVVMAALPLMIAFLAPETWGGKVIAILIAVAIAFGSCHSYIQRSRGKP